MIRQQFSVRHYWEVIVWYSLDYNLFPIVRNDLKRLGMQDRELDRVYRIMREGRAKAVTLSSVEKHLSIVLFNVHSDRMDYLNSIVHEAEHVKQAMLEAYKVEDRGEPPAYTIGHLVEKMYKVFIKI